MISGAEQASIFDTRALADLQRQAKQNSPAANKAIAQQFEALFTQMILKSMRQTLQGDSLTDSDSTRFYQGLQDQQMGLVLSKQGGFGLAASLERLMNGQTAPGGAARYPFSPAPALVPGSEKAPAAAAQAPTTAPATGGSAQAFVQQVWPQALEAARGLGVPPHFLVGQAALETGWGKSQIRKADGSPSYNLFNIKAGRGWGGEVAEASTTEYENGQAVSRVERFRAYGSYAEAFADYARLLGSSSRYAEVRGQTDASAFAGALQKAGYATDPAYAAKLTRVINGQSLRLGMLASAV